MDFQDGMREYIIGLQGQRWNWSEFSELYRKLESAYKLGVWVNESVCNIV